jgi:glycosyltransferase involved in cell wall biosynthesis
MVGRRAVAQSQGGALTASEIAVVISAWNRPQYLAECLASIRGQLGDPLPIYLHVDGGGECEEEIERVVDSARLNGLWVRFEEENLGCNAGTKATIDWAWELGYNWALYLEDDFVLSPDALRLARWYVDNADLLAEECGGWIGAFCLCRLGATGDPRDVLFSRAFLGWGFVMSKAQYDIIEPAWLSGEKDTPPSMWDRHVGRRIRNLDPDNYNCQPALSRITNIGELVFHFSPGRHRKWMKDHRWNQSTRQFAFRLGGWTADAELHREAGWKPKT